MTCTHHIEHCAYCSTDPRTRRFAADIDHRNGPSIPGTVKTPVDGWPVCEANLTDAELAEMARPKGRTDTLKTVVGGDGRFRVRATNGSLVAEGRIRYRGVPVPRPAWVRAFMAGSIRVYDADGNVMELDEPELIDPSESAVAGWNGGLR